MHLNEDLVKVEREFIDDSQTKFQPILTDLYRTSQPIVRYRLNDVLTLQQEPCSCGSAFTAISSIDGRQDDVLYFRKPDSSGYVPVFSDFVRNHILYIDEEIKEYYVTQESDERILIQLNCDCRSLNSAREQVREQIENLASKLNSVCPNIEFIEFAPKDGFEQKMRRIISKFHP